MKYYYANETEAVQKANFVQETQTCLTQGWGKKSQEKQLLEEFVI